MVVIAYPRGTFFRIDQLLKVEGQLENAAMVVSVSVVCLVAFVVACVQLCNRLQQ